MNEYIHYIQVRFRAAFAIFNRRRDFVIKTPIAYRIAINLRKKERGAGDIS